MDTFFLQFLTEELRGQILGYRISQIMQHSRNEFQLKFREKARPFFISLNSQNPIIFLSQVPHTETHITPFSMALSKHLDGSQIEGLIAIPLERILQFTFKRRNLKGYFERNHLYLELIAKAANAILTNEQKKIIASFSYPSQRGRSYSQGADYILPAQENRYNPFDINKAEFESLALDKIKSTKELIQAIVKNISGFSPLVAGEVCFIAQKRGVSLWEAFFSIINRISSKKTSPTIYAPEKTFSLQNLDINDKQLILSPISLYSKEDIKFRTLISFNQAASEYFNLWSKIKTFISKKKRLLSILKNSIKRLERLKAKLQREYEEAEKSEEFKQCGELLLSNFSLIQKGKKSVRLVNYFDPLQREIDIPLNPNLSPQRNAQRYFDKYNKAKRSRAILKARLRKQTEKLDSIREIEKSIYQASNPSQLQSVEEKMASYDIKVQIRTTSPRLAEKSKQAKYIQFKSSDGLVILVGKNSKANEYLTFKLAGDNDFWLHAAGQSGSHVIVRNPHRINKLPDKSLQETAQIAAYFSKARNAGRALVHYTQRKHVRKAKGKAAGKVLLRSYRTTSVKPCIANSVIQL